MRHLTPVAVLAAVLGASAAALPARAQDAKNPAPKDPAKPAGPAAPAAPLQAWEFPREFTVAGRKFALSEPRVVGRDAKTGELRLRFPAQSTDGAGRITWGAIDATGRPHYDLASRLVLVDGLAAAAPALPQLQEDAKADVVAGVAGAFPKEVLLRLELVAAAPAAAPAEPAAAPKLSMSAPEILVRRWPSVLVQIDGEAVLDVVEDFPFEYVLNTAADLFRDPKTTTWYLLADGWWLEAKKLEGPWKLAATPPLVLSQMKVTHPRGHVRMFLPGTPEYAQRTGGKKQTPPATLPEVIVRDKPAELVLLEGDPLFLMIPNVGNRLMVVANTESDLLYHPKSSLFYLLLSGRWFQAEDVQGPWKEAFGSLPEDFAKIPPDHVRAHVLWCVPGTAEAAEAAALAQIEERIALAGGTRTEVRYDGKEIRTVPLEGTPLKLVVNTEDDVLQAEGAYWCCARGAWFRSDDGRSWELATALPAAIDQIPESSGAYHARFCRPYGKAEAGVVFGATGGYLGTFLWKGAPIYGTGYAKRGLLRDGNWYPAARTYGENRWYDPLSGVFQPRTARYDAEGRLVASEWSPYTAGYGRVKWYASRYDQGGRRMFPFGADTGKFDTAAGRPDPWETWGTQVKEREGLKVERFPLGDRSSEAAPREAPVVAAEDGTVWRAGAKGVETYKDAAWVAADKVGDAEKAWLAALARLNARPAQLRAWAEKRRAALPVNPTVTK